MDVVLATYNFSTGTGVEAAIEQGDRASLGVVAGFPVEKEGGSILVEFRRIWQEL